jgi:hypothetical protein
VFNCPSPLALTASSKTHHQVWLKCMQGQAQPSTVPVAKVTPMEGHINARLDAINRQLAGVYEQFRDALDVSGASIQLVHGYLIYTKDNALPDPSWGPTTAARPTENEYVTCIERGGTSGESACMQHGDVLSPCCVLNRDEHGTTDLCPSEAAHREGHPCRLQSADDGGMSSTTHAAHLLTTCHLCMLGCEVVLHQSGTQWADTSMLAVHLRCPLHKVRGLGLLVLHSSQSTLKDKMCLTVSLATSEHQQRAP